MRASNRRIENLLSLTLTKAGFGFQQAWGALQQHIPAAYIARVTGASAFLLKSGAPCPEYNHATGPCSGVGYTGLTADSVITKSNHRGGWCCGQAPRPFCYCRNESEFMQLQGGKPQQESFGDLSQSATDKVVFLPLLIVWGNLF